MAAARLHRLQEEYRGRLIVVWRSFLLLREDSHRGWNDYVAAHWQRAQEAEPTLRFRPWRGSFFPSTTMAAHVAGKAVGRQGPQLFDAFHLGAMRAFFADNANLEDPALLRAVAEGAGVDLARFDDDVADPDLKQVVWREFTQGVEQERVTAIPTMFIGERCAAEGALTVDRYRRLFDAALVGRPS